MKTIWIVGTVSLCALCGACSPGETLRQVPPGTIVVATSGEPETLFPPLMVSMMSRQVNEQIFDYLAAVGPELSTIGDSGFQPQLADSWAWSEDSLSIAFHIHPGARWHDGAVVTSEDIRYSFAVHADSVIGSTAATQLANIDSVSAPTPATAVFWFKKRSPLQFFDATNQMLIIPKHVYGAVGPGELRKKAGDLSPVGSGRFQFNSWNHGASIELRADTGNYRGKPGIGRLMWLITPSAVTATAMLFAGRADIYDTIRPENLREVSKHGDINIVLAPGTAYAFMQFNLRDPKQPNMPHALFASRALRRALTMAVDREAMVRNVFDSLARAGFGPGIRAYPSTDTTLAQIPYDPVAAGQILDREGWLRSDDGYRRNGQRVLQFTILVPASSTNRQRMAVLLQEQLRMVGVRATLEQVDFSTFGSRLQQGRFDAALGSVQMGSSPSAVKEAWGSSAVRAKGGANYGTYASTAFDLLVDSAADSNDPREANRLYNAAYQIAIDDAPAIWLYEPRLVMGVHNRIRMSRVRPDAWWSSIAEWQIPATERIARDLASVEETEQ